MPRAARAGLREGLWGRHHRRDPVLGLRAPRRSTPPLLHLLPSPSQPTLHRRAQAYANNQWALGDALTDDPGQTSFHKAMALAEGTVSVLDKDGTVFTRIWCGYEVYVSLAAPPERYAEKNAYVHGVYFKKGDPLPYKWCVYTALQGVVHAENTGLWVKKVPAVGSTDGLALCDGSLRPPQKYSAGGLGL